jgi:SAM-dependent methyltransferase
LHRKGRDREFLCILSRNWLRKFKNTRKKTQKKGLHVSDPTMQSQVEAARAYETLFVPALVGQFAPKVADAARVGQGERVLDVACGTGVLARETLKRVGPSGRVVGIDVVPGMLEVAQQIEPDIEWRQGKAESLPFSDGSFDAVVSQFGLMFFLDRLQAIREMLRVLTSGGRLAVAVWNSLQSIPAYAVAVELFERIGGKQAADALRAPFVLGGPDELRDMFRDAGAYSIEVTTHSGRALFPSIRVMVEADLRGWLPVMGVNLSEEQISQILYEAEAALAPYVTSDGQVRFDISAHIVTAKASE